MDGWVDDMNQVARIAGPVPQLVPTKARKFHVPRHMKTEINMRLKGLYIEVAYVINSCLATVRDLLKEVEFKALEVEDIGPMIKDMVAVIERTGRKVEALIWEANAGGEQVFYLPQRHLDALNYLNVNWPARIEADPVVVEEADGAVVEEADGAVVEEADGAVVEEADGAVVEEADGEVVEEADGAVVEEADGAVVEEADGVVLEEADRAVVEEADGEVVEEADGVVLEEADGAVVAEADGEVVEEAAGQIGGYLVMMGAAATAIIFFVAMWMVMV